MRTGFGLMAALLLLVLLVHPQPLAARTDDILASKAQAIRAPLPRVKTSDGVQGKAILSTGPKVDPRDYPWVIGLRVRGAETARCGGVLIGNRYVLTAAHCVDRRGFEVSKLEKYSSRELEAFATTARFGDYEIDLDHQFGVEVHENYKAGGSTIAFDAALLRLAEQPAGATVAPLRVVPVKDGNAIISGWGDHPGGPNGLLRAEIVPVVPNARCRERVPVNRSSKIGDWSLCSEHRSAVACSRDSGGPLVVGSREQPQTIGVVSFGPDLTCGMSTSGKPLWSVYTAATAVAGWVLKKTGDASTISAEPLEPLMPLRGQDTILPGEI